MGETLSLREINRATLDRQLLLRRARMDPADAVEHLVGLQTQVPPNHYTALWTRLEGFEPETFSDRFERREFVRIALLRGTIHTVTARDCVALRPLFRSILERTLKSAFGRQLPGVDLDRAADRARQLVEKTPMTFTEIGKVLVEGWPDATPQALGQVARHRLAMVQVPPRGLWHRGGLTRHTTAEHWLGGMSGPETGPDELVMRYLAAFGPASVMDAQNWSGLTRLREVVDRHRDELVTFRDENGVELFDLPDAPRPGADVPAPARFLPEYDNVFIGHKDRTRIIRREDMERTWYGNTAFPVFLVDGFIEGTWRLETDKRRTRATLTLSPFRGLAGDQRGELETEGAALLAFEAPEAEHDIRWDTA